MTTPIGHRSTLRISYTLAGVALWSAGLSPARSADASQSAPTLAQALAHAAPPKSDLYITVNAHKVSLPKDAPAPAAGDTAAQIAAEYGRLVTGFGRVDAITATTFVVVNSPPLKPDPYDGMEPKQLIKILTSGFVDGQWKDFLSERGVGYADLTTDNQRAAFEALFPDGVMKIARGGAKKEIQGAELRQARLRLTYVTSVALPISGKTDEHVFTGGDIRAAGPEPYKMENLPFSDVDREYGVEVRSRKPAVAKPTDLDEDDPAFHPLVPVAGWKTVEDVIRAIAAATGREIYADPRYAAKSVTLLGAKGAVRAIDLMRALALCVGGTYRQVGPAFVLTNDIIGLGSKHELWRLFESRAAAMVAAPPAAPTTYTQQDIRWTSDEISPTQTQIDDYWKKWREDPRSARSDSLELYLPLQDLSATQLSAVRELQAQAVKAGQVHTTLEGTILVQSEPVVQAILPALDAPVILYDTYDNLLPPPPHNSRAIHEREEKLRQSRQSAAGAKEDKPQSLAALLAGFARRAVRLEPKSGAEVTDDLARMHDLGMNELWLKITPGTDTESDDDSIRLLQQTIVAAKAAKIAVYPDISLFVWRKYAGDEFLDRTVTDRTPMDENLLSPPPPPNVINPVSLVAPKVGERLSELIGRTSRVDGVAGMVWDNMTPRGYEQRAQFDSDWGTGAPLGYSVPARLAFLRKTHADPIDTHNNSFTATRAHVAVPGFDDDQSYEQRLYEDWRKFRISLGQMAVHSLTSALPDAFLSGPNRLPLLALPANNPMEDLYGSWDDFAKPSPALELVPWIGPDGKPIPGTERGHLRSSLVYRTVYVTAWPGASSSQIAARVIETLETDARNGEKNIVIDSIADPHSLETLSDAVSASAGDHP
ncbi:hypothetical protein CCAX7_56570 [Capsulimonas corticalis]|uniref:Uncharacterized protein n=1 Tax=Capsulimonas corticalis TaxID=2219043 RepID=A0A402D0M5_9BACT|nr:hypothetical protein [Capsulimonas corticalis]BDI33606.1 hypothetical protein CCAX7_56570 [Capsulimonas corticalis]